jgi:hypothetical protein
MKRVQKRRPVQKYLKLVRLSSITPSLGSPDSAVYENCFCSSGSATPSLQAKKRRRW